MLDWDYEGLSGTIPAEIGAHSVIRHLFSDHNELSGSIPPTIGALTNLKSLDLNRSHLSGVVPSTLSNLTNLEYMDLTEKCLTNSQTKYLGSKPRVQDYLSTLWRRQALLFLNHGIAITKNRQDAPSTTTSTSLFFIYLTRCEDATDHILSFLNPITYGVSTWSGMRVHPKLKKKTTAF